MPRQRGRRRGWQQGQYPAPSPAGMGHNQGPPLFPANNWSAFCWGKARKAAWKTPPIEVVRRRCRQACDLGLSYRDYTAIVLDLGTHPFVLIFDLGGTLVEIENDEIHRDPQGRIKPLPGVVEKLSGLAGYKVFVVTNQAGVAEGLNTAEEAQSFVEQVNELCSGVITDYCICMEPAASGSEFRKPRPSVVIGLLAAHKLPPAAAVMVGDSENDRKCAAAANLAGFVWARDYFGWK